MNPKPGRVDVADDVPMPVIAEHECLVRIRASGFRNGTDRKIIRDETGSMPVPFPLLLGHASVGAVIGAGRRVRGWTIGERMPTPSFRLMPGTRHGRMRGAMGEYAVPADHLAMPEFEMALVRFLRHLGASWIGAVGHREERLSRLRDIGGAGLGGNARAESAARVLGEPRFDQAIDAVGSSGVITEAADLVTPGGSVGVAAVLGSEASSLDLLRLPTHITVHLLSPPYREHGVHDGLLRPRRFRHEPAAGLPRPRVAVGVRRGGDAPGRRAPGVHGRPAAVRRRPVGGRRGDHDRRAPGGGKSAAAESRTRIQS